MKDCHFGISPVYHMYFRYSDSKVSFIVKKKMYCLERRRRISNCTGKERGLTEQPMHKRGCFWMAHTHRVSSIQKKRLGAYLMIFERYFCQFFIKTYVVGTH